MPPKKKEEKKTPVEEDGPDEEEKELMERELVINYLKSKLGKFQSKGEVLEDENVKLSKELDQSRINLRDINEFLTNELKARSLTSAALEQKMMELEDEMQRMQEEFAEAARKLAESKDAEIHALKEEIDVMKEKRKEVDMFLEQKKEMEEQIESLEKRIKELEFSHAQEISNLERKHVQDKDRWKKEMAQKIKETKAQMMKLTDNQLEVTTKRTIMENEQMSTELAYQSRQTERLLEKNRELLEEAGDLRRQVDLYKQTEMELAKRNHVYQKTIKTLLGKLKLQGSQRKTDEENVQDLEGALQELQERAKHAEMAVGEKVHEVTMLTDTLQTTQVSLKNMEEKYDDTAKFLTACLNDVKRKIVTITRADGDALDDQVQVNPGKLEELGLDQRELALTYLLERLHVYQATSGGMGSLSAQGVVFGSPPPGYGQRDGQLSGPNGVALPPIVTPPQYQARGGGGMRGVQPMEMPWPMPGGGIMEHPNEGHMEQQAGGGMDPMGPGADVLMGKLMTDVRPWGKKSKDTVMTTKHKKGGFLKRGGGISAGSVNSSVTYKELFEAR